ncbi:MAG: DUF1205 domain-containing protein [Nocardioides alkalitolerans]
MRVLLVSQAEWSHAAGLVPVGWGLRAAGHDVLFATQPDLVATLATSGLPTVGVGRDHRLGALLQRVPPRRRVSGGMDTACLRPGVDGEVVARGYTYLVRWWWALVSDPMCAGLVALARRWRPDLVVWETTTFAGAVAAEAVGARHVRFAWSLDLVARFRRQFLRLRSDGVPDPRPDPLEEWMGRSAAPYGVEFSERLVHGEATITQLPATLRAEDPADVTYLPVRHVPYNGSRPVPSWVLTEPPTPPGRPRVSVCLGSSSVARFGRYVCSAREVVHGLAALDVEVVAALAPSEHASLGSLPGNVRLEEHVPLDALLPTCAVAVNHGGPGTVATAAVHGVPQLVLPAEFDAPLLADGLVAQGAARSVPAEEADAATVRDHVTALLDGPSHRRAARALRDEVRAMPDPYALGTTLTDLVRDVPAAPLATAGAAR